MDITGYVMIAFFIGALFGIGISFFFVEREERRFEKEHKNRDYYDFCDWAMRRIERDSKPIDFSVGG